MLLHTYVFQSIAKIISSKFLVYHVEELLLFFIEKYVYFSRKAFKKEYVVSDVSVHLAQIILEVVVFQHTKTNTDDSHRASHLL